MHQNIVSKNQLLIVSTIRKLQVLWSKLCIDYQMQTKREGGSILPIKTKEKYN